MARGSAWGRAKCDPRRRGDREFVDWLVTLAGGQPERVGVAIEVPRGALVETLVERGGHVYALNPKQLDRFRDRYTVAGPRTIGWTRSSWPLRSAPIGRRFVGSGSMIP